MGFGGGVGGWVIGGSSSLSSNGCVWQQLDCQRTTAMAPRLNRAVCRKSSTPPRGLLGAAAGAAAPAGAAAGGLGWAAMTMGRGGVASCELGAESACACECRFVDWKRGVSRDQCVCRLRDGGSMLMHAGAQSLVAARVKQPLQRTSARIMPSCLLSVDPLVQSSPCFLLPPPFS